MGQAEVALVRRNYEVINSIGRTGAEFVDPEEFAPDLWARLAPDFELHERPDLPDANVYRGRQESKGFWRKTQELFAEIRWEPHDFVDLGQAIVVETTITARGRGSDVIIEAAETDVFWFRDEAIAQLQAFPTREDGLRAAERPPPPAPPPDR